MANHSQDIRPSGSTADSVTKLSSDRGPEAYPWDTSDPFFSAHTRDLLNLIFKCYVRQIIVFVGVPGNVLCCIVFLKQGLADKINLLLFSLAVADFSNLATQICFPVTCYLNSWDPLQAANWETIVYTKIAYVNRIVSFVSGTLIVVLSVDRCLSVVMPLKAGRVLTYRPMLAVIVLTYLIHLICYLPSLVVFTVKWKTDPSTNRSVAYKAIVDSVAIDSDVTEEFTTVIHLLFKPISIVVVVVCCVVTIAKLRQAARQRRQMIGGAKEESAMEDARVTKMLLFLCIVYVVLVIPELACSIAYSVDHEFFTFRKYHNTFVIVFEVIIFNASCLNSAINFFAYLALSTKFRTTLKNLCHCKLRKYRK